MRPDDQSVKRCATGFTLAEMAIVLVVVGLLLTSVLSTVSTQIEARNISDTKAKLDQIKDALIGFAQANGRLPCPADGWLATGAAGAGQEEKTGNVCKTPATRYAVLPWATLGVPETDVWGRRFTYVVDVNFADLNAANSWGGCVPTPTPVAPTSFALCSTGSLTVKTKTPANKVGTDVTGVPAVIISHGKNGYGAFTSSGIPPAPLPTAPPAVDVDETTNSPASASTTFVSREQSPQSTGCSDTAAGNFCEFDDLVAYVPVSVLVTKMVSAGKLP